MNTTVKLAKLRLSDINVRKSAELEIEPLAADIAARGVLQNLLVTPVTKPRGTFEVFDGGRRLRALQLLAEHGEIDAESYDVTVMVLKGDDATLSETSLAANFHQLKMTPAEECRAFQHFLGKDGDLDAVARRFGQTRKFIEGRLRLANLAEPIFDALAAGKLTLDKAKAYASTESHDKQLRAFETYGTQDYYSADTIRRAIAGDAMRATDPVARLVGAQAYQAKGGRIERDLFAEDTNGGGDRWIDPEIAQGIAAEVMTAEATRIGEETGLAWIRPIAANNSWQAASGLHLVPLEPVPPTEAEQARIDTIETRMMDIVDLLDGVGEVDEDEGDDPTGKLEAEYRDLEAELEDLNNRPRALPEALRLHVGAFLLLRNDGTMALEAKYFSETPIARDGDGEGGSAPMPGRPSTRDETTVAPGGKPMSARLVDELAVHRRDVLAAAILADPALALDYMLFALADGSRAMVYTSHGTTIAARRPDDPQLPKEMAVTAARSAIAAARDGLDDAWSEGATIVERFEAFRALSDDMKAAWLAAIVAGSIEAKPSTSARAHPLHARLAELLEVDVAAWWRPTAESYFDRVPKASLLALLHEVGGPAISQRYSGSKKAEIASACEKLFAGEAIVEPEVKAAALAWVPPAMRFTSNATADLASELTADLDDDEDIGDVLPADEDETILDDELVD